MTRFMARALRCPTYGAVVHVIRKRLRSIDADGHKATVDRQAEIRYGGQCASSEDLRVQWEPVLPGPSWANLLDAVHSVLRDCESIRSRYCRIQSVSRIESASRAARLTSTQTKRLEYSSWAPAD